MIPRCGQGEDKLVISLRCLSTCGFWRPWLGLTRALEKALRKTCWYKQLLAKSRRAFTLSWVGGFNQWRQNLGVHPTRKANNNREIQYSVWGSYSRSYYHSICIHPTLVFRLPNAFHTYITCIPATGDPHTHVVAEPSIFRKSFKISKDIRARGQYDLCIQNIYPPFGFDVLHLVIRTFADALAAPQLHSDLKVGVAHGADR